MSPTYYAIADIHGRADLLQEAHDRIEADIYLRDIAEARVVYLGDFGDHGRTFKAVLNLVRRGVDGAQCVRLRGNHDEMLLAFLHDRDPETAGHWVRSYGHELFLEAGVKLPVEDLAAARTCIREYLGSENVRMLEETVLFHRAASIDAVFVHAGLRHGATVEDQAAHDLLNIRRGFIDSPHDYGALVVHGHTIYPTPQYNGHRLGVDTGAHRTGVLTVAVIAANEIRFLQTNTEESQMGFERLAHVAA